MKERLSTALFKALAPLLECYQNRHPVAASRIGELQTVREVLMKRQERADFVAYRLEELYPETSIPLDHQDPYTFWLLSYSALNAPTRW